MVFGGRFFVALMPTCRVFFDEPSTGAWNMAVDETLLESAAAGGGWAMRFYTWSEPTLSLGYFQACGDRRWHGASADCPMVRRPSGGGAILHDRELTYAMLVPLEKKGTPDARWLYETVHSMLLSLLRSARVEAVLWSETNTCRGGGNAFLCFQRRGVGDVVLDHHKVAGSAQRRRYGAVLLHGSLLLSASPFAPELPGLEQLTGRFWSGEEWSERLAAGLGSAFALDLFQEHLTDEERARATELVRDKYGNASWNLRK